MLRLDVGIGPIILVRQDDGTVRAFYNTCQHRGSALVLEPTVEAARRLTCPYHGWVYRLDGTLAGYPDAGDFDELDHTCLALRDVRCATWGPLVFVDLDPDAAPLLDWLSPVSDDLAELGGLTSRLHLADTRSRDVAVNWKLPVDANIETYHVNVAHRRTAAGFIDQAQTGIWLLRNGHSRMLIRLRDGVDGVDTRGGRRRQRRHRGDRGGARRRAGDDQRPVLRRTARRLARHVHRCARRRRRRRGRGRPVELNVAGLCTVDGGDVTDLRVVSGKLGVAMRLSRPARR